MKVDVVIHVYGKPWQTLCTLKSLMLYSSEHIDKIYFVTEPKQPYNEKVDWVIDYFDNIIQYTPIKSILMNICKNVNNEIERHSMYCQYALEKTDKQYIFVTHNDILYTDDIIGDMINNIEDNIAIGELGQCWNCPAQQFCGGGAKWNSWNPTEEEINQIKEKLPYVRTSLNNLTPNKFKLMPECRLNEWACLINVELSNKETYPNGNTPFFGEFHVDSGTAWFKSLYLKGYNFKDYRKNYSHTYWSDLSNGYQTVLKENYYWKAEQKAEQYFNENFKI
ncbi:MAG TPA: hypothetical protein PKD00_00150 [Burkholderiales bacterium]|nr:hypothetical protein [Burkholderiales bacterium]